MELSEEKYSEALNKSCDKNFHKLVEQQLTEQEKKEFCNCVVDYYVAETEEYTMNSIISIMKDTDAFEKNLQECADEANSAKESDIIGIEENVNDSIPSE